jgi:predicted O-methyltransferase YrrM
MEEFYRTKKKLDNILEIMWEKINSESQDNPLKYTSFSEMKRHAEEGSITIKRALVIAFFINFFKPKNIIEIGSFLGFSCNFMLEISKEWNANVTSIDPNVRHRIFEYPREYFKLMTNDHSNNIKMIDGFFSLKTEEGGKWDYLNIMPIKSINEINSIINNIPLITEKDFTENEKYDLGFIDGAHEYSSVISNFICLSKIMVDGGFIIFDDVCPYWNSVVNAIHDIENKALSKNFGIMLYSNDVAIFKDNGFFSYIKKNNKID